MCILVSQKLWLQRARTCLTVFIRYPVKYMIKKSFTYFLLSTFIYFFTHNTTQHPKYNKKNNRHILNISKSSQKGGREGRTTKSQKSQYVHTCMLYIHKSLFAGGYGPNMFFHTCAVCKPVQVQVQVQDLFVTYMIIQRVYNQQWYVSQVRSMDSAIQVHLNKLECREKVIFFL